MNEVITSTFSKKLAKLPNVPGVYLYKNRQGNVLYVGKAKDLRKRVQSYFRPNADLQEAKQIMLQQLTSIDWIETNTETDALVLEDKLIKDYQPRFNVLAKDDKGFLYIHITAEEFPRVLAVRRPNLKYPGIYYGPYPFARSIRDVLKLLHSIFPYRTCNRLPTKACLEYYIGQCNAPCIGNISQADYTTMIDQIIDFFEGNTKEIISELQVRMQNASNAREFEQAIKFRNQLAAIKKLQSFQKTPRQYLEQYYQHTALDPQVGLHELQTALQLTNLPERIEVYDISHQQGVYTVGSMIVFNNGFPDKAEYRRFKIKTVQGPDDFKSLQEMIRRRLKRDWPLPDLAVIDGGKGQLSAVAPFWQDKHVPVVALAKRQEEIFSPNESIPLTLASGSQGLFLMQRMRDEAHRFAITYYRKLHRKTMRAK